MGQYTMAGLGAPSVTTRQIDPAVPGIITASGGAVRDVTSGIADIWRASRGEAAPSDAAAEAADAFVDPGSTGSFWSTTPGHVVIIGGVLLAVTAVGLVAFTKKKERVANRRRSRARRLANPYRVWVGVDRRGWFLIGATQMADAVEKEQIYGSQIPHRITAQDASGNWHLTTPSEARRRGWRLGERGPARRWR